MPLNRDLGDTILSFPCPHSGHVLQRKGSWFNTVEKYTCGGCHVRMQMGYAQKLQLFEDYATAAAVSPPSPTS